MTATPTSAQARVIELLRAGPSSARTLRVSVRTMLAMEDKGLIRAACARRSAIPCDQRDIPWRLARAIATDA